MSTSAASLTAVLAAGASSLAAMVSIAVTRRAAERDRKRQLKAAAAPYSDPLLHAAFNLQSRMFNICRQNFFRDFFRDGELDDREYAIHNTLFLIGQYLCWAEILRIEAQFIDPLNAKREREIMDAMETVRYVMADSLKLQDRTLRVFRGDQRAIGEVLLVTLDAPAGRGGPRWGCMGYAQFSDAMRSGEPWCRWFTNLSRDLVVLAENPNDHDARMIKLQGVLVDLVNLLDPKGHRVTLQLRQKLAAQR